MFRRIRWMVMGAGLGASASMYAKRKVKRFLRTYTPPEVAARAAASAKAEWRAALNEGKAAMRAKEAELRSTTRKPPASSHDGPGTGPVSLPKKPRP